MEENLEDKKWHLVCWKEFNNRKMEDKSVLIRVTDTRDVLNNMKTMNAQKLKTSTDYRIVNLEELFAQHNLQIVDSVQLNSLNEE